MPLKITAHKRVFREELKLEVECNDLLIGSWIASQLRNTFGYATTESWVQEKLDGE